MQISIEKKDTVKLLPEEAWQKIQTLLFNCEADAPGREEQIELYCKMLYHAAHTAQAQNLLLLRKCAMYKKTFTNWLPHLKKCRGDST